MEIDKAKIDKLIGAFLDDHQKKGDERRRQWEDELSRAYANLDQDGFLVVFQKEFDERRRQWVEDELSRAYADLNQYGFLVVFQKEFIDRLQRELDNEKTNLQFVTAKLYEAQANLDRQKEVIERLRPQLDELDEVREKPLNIDEPECLPAPLKRQCN